MNESLMRMSQESRKMEIDRKRERESLPFEKWIRKIKILLPFFSSLTKEYTY